MDLPEADEDVCKGLECSEESEYYPVHHPLDLQERRTPLSMLLSTKFSAISGQVHTEKSLLIAAL